MKATTMARPAAVTLQHDASRIRIFRPLGPQRPVRRGSYDRNRTAGTVRSWIEHWVIEREAIAPYADK
jgi:hypothetical protein